MQQENVHISKSSRQMLWRNELFHFQERIVFFFFARVQSPLLHADMRGRFRRVSRWCAAWRTDTMSTTPCSVPFCLVCSGSRQVTVTEIVFARMNHGFCVVHVFSTLQHLQTFSEFLPNFEGSKTNLLPLEIWCLVWGMSSAWLMPSWFLALWSLGIFGVCRTERPLDFKVHVLAGLPKVKLNQPGTEALSSSFLLQASSWIFLTSTPLPLILSTAYSPESAKRSCFVFGQQIRLRDWTWQKTWQKDN